MDLLQLFLGANLVELLMRIVFLLLGGIFMFILFPMFGSATHILYCRERDGRGADLAVKFEDEVRLDTSNNLRFFKHGRSYAFVGMMRRMKSIFFAKEGTAYTAKLMGFSGKSRLNDEENGGEWTAENLKGKKKVDLRAILEEGEIPYKIKDNRTTLIELIRSTQPDKKDDGPTQIELEFPTVWEAVKFKLGDAFLRPFPEDKKKLLMNDKFLVTVGLEPGLTPEGYMPATEQDIDDKGNRDMAKLLGEAAKMALHGGFIDKIPWIGFGVAIGLIGCMALGWIPVNSPLVG